MQEETLCKLKSPIKLCLKVMPLYSNVLSSFFIISFTSASIIFFILFLSASFFNISKQLVFLFITALAFSLVLLKSSDLA